LITTKRAMRRRAKKPKYKIAWQLIITMSFCLNIFGAYTMLARQWASLGFVKREAIKLACDGIKYRIFYGK